jgi:hypothetical protein
MCTGSVGRPGDTVGSHNSPGFLTVGEYPCNMHDSTFVSTSYIATVLGCNYLGVYPGMHQ